jgi:hypothetical protein
VEPVDPRRVLVATVAEDREAHAREILYLFKTLQHFGGRLSGARQKAYFVGSADSPTIERVSDLGVAIDIVESVDERRPHANKIRMLHAPEDCDYLVALDTDVVVTRDFSAFIQGSSVAAKPAGQMRLSLDEWQELFGHFGVDLPQARYLTTARFQETIPYFNTGVLIVPSGHLPTLRDEWLSFVERLLDAAPELPMLAEHRAFFVDQFAFALALAAARLPFRGLPLELNFPTDRRVDPALEPQRLAPYILHHHHRLSPEGRLLFCEYDEINALITAVNACLESEAPAPA